MWDFQGQHGNWGGHRRQLPSVPSVNMRLGGGGELLGQQNWFVIDKGIFGKNLPKYFSFIASAQSFLLCYLMSQIWAGAITKLWQTVLYWRHMATESWVNNAIQTVLIQIFGECTVLFLGFCFVLCFFLLYFAIFQLFRHQNLYFLWNSVFSVFFPNTETGDFTLCPLLSGNQQWHHSIWGIWNFTGKELLYLLGVVVIQCLDFILQRLYGSGFLIKGSMRWEGTVSCSENEGPRKCTWPHGLSHDKKKHLQIGPGRALKPMDSFGMWWKSNEFMFLHWIIIL